MVSPSVSGSKPGAPYTSSHSVSSLPATQLTSTELAVILSNAREVGLGQVGIGSKEKSSI